MVIASCRKDIEAIARDYYAKLFPPEAKGGAGGKKPPATPPGKGAKAGEKPGSAAGKQRGGKKGEAAAAATEDEGPTPVRPIR